MGRPGKLLPRPNRSDRSFGKQLLESQRHLVPGGACAKNFWTSDNLNICYTYDIPMVYLWYSSMKCQFHWGKCRKTRIDQWIWGYPIWHIFDDSSWPCWTCCRFITWLANGRAMDKTSLCSRRLRQRVGKITMELHGMAWSGWWHTESAKRTRWLTPKCGGAEQWRTSRVPVVCESWVGIIWTWREGAIRIN